MLKKRIFYSIIIIGLLVAVYTFGFYIGKNQVVCKACKPENIDFSLFWDAYEKLQSSFINPEKIDEQKIIYGAISGMMKSLDDPYTEFFDPEQAKMFEQDLAGSFDGIGAEIGIKKGGLTIIAPLKGTPADLAGLRAGDQIIKINGESSLDMPVDLAVGKIRGKKGTEIVLTIFREGWRETKDVKIVRETIKIESVKWELKDGNIAYLQIRYFNQSLPSDFKKIASEIINSGAKKIIIDLRDNPGGYLEVSKNIAGWFLLKGEIVTVEDFGGKKEQEFHRTDGNSKFADYPTVILINKGSASASEILAGAIKDNRGVKIVGEKSFGKGSVQEVMELQDGKSFLKITVAKWLTPKGNLISEIGLSPDENVAITDNDFELGNDPQMDKAIEIIKKIN